MLEPGGGVGSSISSERLSSDLKLSSLREAAWRYCCTDVTGVASAAAERELARRRRSEEYLKLNELALTSRLFLLTSSVYSAGAVEPHAYPLMLHL